MQPSSPGDFDGNTAKADKKVLKIVGAAVAAVVAIVVGITLASGDDESAESTFLTTIGPSETVAFVPDDTDTVAFEPLPTVCDVLDAATVGQIVGGRIMTAAPMPAGNGCLFTSNEQPNIDLTTAYPPFIQQVSLTYNAPQPGQSAEDIAALYESSRSATAVEIPGPAGGDAYSGGGGDAVVLDNGVMIICSTSGTTRPESIPEIQAMCVTIAGLLRAELP